MIKIRVNAYLYMWYYTEFEPNIKKNSFKYYQSPDCLLGCLPGC